MMFLKHSFNHSNTCCEQTLKEREIKTHTTTFSSHSLRWTEDKRHKISKDLNKQLHKQHYQLHLLLTRLTLFLSHIYRSSYWELRFMFRLRSPSWRLAFALVALLTPDFCWVTSLSAIAGVFRKCLCIDKAGQQTNDCIKMVKKISFFHCWFKELKCYKYKTQPMWK